MTTEVEKYQQCYALPTYKLQGARLRRVSQNIDMMAAGASYLDVGCGRGEMVKLANRNGVKARGMDLVPELADSDIMTGSITAIPFDDQSFDYVSCYDCLEHLPPEEVDQALDELFRVVRHTLLITTNNKPSHLGDLTLHLTRMPMMWWDGKLRERANAIGPEYEMSFDVYGSDEWHWRICLAR